MGENTKRQGSTGFFFFVKRQVRLGFSCVLGHKNNIASLFSLLFLFFLFDVNACVKVGSWNVFKLSLDADCGFASAPWFHFMGRGHVDKSNTRITDKWATLFFLFLFSLGRAELLCAVHKCVLVHLPVACVLSTYAWLPIWERLNFCRYLSRYLSIQGSAPPLPPDTLAQVWKTPDEHARTHTHSRTAQHSTAHVKHANEVEAEGGKEGKVFLQCFR